MEYTCEIHASKMFIKEGYIYWIDSEDVSETDFEDYEGVTICALKLRWRSIEDRMGQEDFYSESQER